MIHVNGSDCLHYTYFIKPSQIAKTATQRVIQNDLIDKIHARHGSPPNDPIRHHHDHLQPRITAYQSFEIAVFGLESGLVADGQVYKTGDQARIVMVKEAGTGSTAAHLRR